MEDLRTLVDSYLNDCQFRKRLDAKTVRAYRADLKDFAQYLEQEQADYLDKKALVGFVEMLHKIRAPRTVKRKIASLQAFYHYLIYEELITDNPMQRVDLSFKLPRRLPRHIPTHALEDFYRALYVQKKSAGTAAGRRAMTRNVAVIELLFATGLRISELCTLTPQNVNLYDGSILIRGKGDKERILQLTEAATLKALLEYYELFQEDVKSCGYFFVNNYGNRLSEQSVRNMIRRIASDAGIPLHITPHMFRHTFATFLVNQEVDIRCIQELLGHSSIRTTEIYTYVDTARQKDILEHKNPRKLISLTMSQSN